MFDNVIERNLAMEHTHQFEAGVCTICNQAEKIYRNATPDSDHEGHDHSHDSTESPMKQFIPAIISFVVLMMGITLDFVASDFFTGWVRLLLYVIAYVPVGLPVIKDAFTAIRKGRFFSEFFLMTIATLGAFAIGEYPEAVAVMLFYAVGESLQTLAVSRAKANIRTLLDQRPDKATVLQDGVAKVVAAEDLKIGDEIQLKPGERLAIDGVLLNDSSSFDTAALTGESKPNTKYMGETVLAGMINLNTVSQVEVTTAYRDSKLSKILELVQNATSQKAPTELFIAKFARIYTPIVVFLAVGITFIPYLFVQEYVFTEWLYRALVFLVISCPCALVISIPLGYFGGIGAASRNGILVKGSNFLDILARVQHVVMDKTGTLTEGVFKVKDVVFQDDVDRSRLLAYVSLLESNSSHPIATAIHEYVRGEGINEHIGLIEVEEFPGHGLKGVIEDKALLVGNFKLLDKFGVSYDVDPTSFVYTTIATAYDSRFVGYITIADKIKEDAQDTIIGLHKRGVKTMMLSGDKSSVVEHVAGQLGISQAYGDLLPEDKVLKIKAIKSNDESVAFVGDGINDAPVMAWSDVAIAMGGLGSDAAIETADVVIQDDKPSKILVAIKIGKKTKEIVWQNIAFAFGVKAVVLILGAGGLATMWEAVFADVGVALLAILNAVRIQRFRF